MSELFSSAVRCMQAGQLDEAERLCRTILATSPKDVPSLNLLGVIALRSERPHDAIDLIGKAIALDKRNADCHYNLGLALLAASRFREAVRHFERAAALAPRYAGGIVKLVSLSFDQGNQALARGQLDQAITLFRQSVALKPDFAEGYSNLGVALMARGAHEEAATAYRNALAINPNLAMIYANLGRVLAAQGKIMEALSLVRRELTRSQSDDVKALFALCVRSLPPGAAVDRALDDSIDAQIARAMTEGWGRPGDFAGFATERIKLKPAADNVLLLAHLETAPVRDASLERWLTAERRRMLAERDEAHLTFVCALARQCFINEYVFAQEEDEAREVARLRDAVAAGAATSPLQLALLAAYMPLNAAPGVDKLLVQNWPPPVAALLDQQVRQPRQEQDDRTAIPVLTTIEDPVSRAVRAQYEEMPYPRWAKSVSFGKTMLLEQYLVTQFRSSLPRPFARAGRVDILVAGCGTGEHPIETARRYTNAQVLAVDLSLASLAYARRMTSMLGLRNIEFAQADILELDTVGRSFDVIESVGVLHHLSDPAAGLRALVSMLRPNGLMLLGLYSKIARREINAARAFIAERGYGSTAADVRRCRQDLLMLDDSAPLKSVTQFPDFYTTSMCRDLLFHVQELQLTIPEIKTLLAQNGLTFIGFYVEPAVQQIYRARFANDPAMTDLDNWSTLEADNPTVFASMYRFWVQKQ